MGRTVVATSKPAVDLGAVLGIADLEGWESADVLKALGQVSASMRERRLVVGLLLWKLRSLEVDAVYSDRAAEVADACDVDIRTLQRWRVFAETKYALPPPNRRSAARRAISTPRTDTVSLTDERDQQPEKASVDEVIEPTPDPEPPPTPPVTKKPALAQQLSLWDEREARPFFPSRPPASREEAAAAKAHGRAAIEWGMSYRPTPGRAVPVEREKCVHPVTRRIGDSCGDCGQKVRGK